MGQRPMKSLTALSHPRANPNQLETLLISLFFFPPPKRKKKKGTRQKSCSFLPLNEQNFECCELGTALPPPAFRSPFSYLHFDKVRGFLMMHRLTMLCQGETE